MQQNLSFLEDAILRIFNHGDSVCIIIFGRRGTGKTDHGLFIAQVLAAFNKILCFASNIKVHESPFKIDLITNMFDLEFWAANQPGRKLFILDEAGKSLRRRTPMSGLNIALLDKLQILRKYKLSLIMIAPHEKYVDSASLGSDVLDAVIVKPEFKNPKIALYRDILEDREEWFNNIPPTQLKFDTWDIAPFKLEPDRTKPRFTDEQLERLRLFGNGATHKDLGLHPMEMNRLLRKFAKVYTDSLLHTSQYHAYEDIPPTQASQKT